MWNSTRNFVYVDYSLGRCLVFVYAIVVETFELEKTVKPLKIWQTMGNGDF